jgi:hypothetical protein
VKTLIFIALLCGAIAIEAQDVYVTPTQAPSGAIWKGCIVSSLGGGLLGLLGTTTGTCNSSDTSAAVGSKCQANATDGTLPGAWKVDAAITSTGVITVNLTGLNSLGVTPPVKNYNVSCTAAQ